MAKRFFNFRYDTENINKVIKTNIRDLKKHANVISWCVHFVFGAVLYTDVKNMSNVRDNCSKVCSFLEKINITCAKYYFTKAKFICHLRTVFPLGGTFPSFNIILDTDCTDKLAQLPQQTDNSKSSNQPKTILKRSCVTNVKSCKSRRWSWALEKSGAKKPLSQI